MSHPGEDTLVLRKPTFGPTYVRWTKLFLNSSHIKKTLKSKFYKWNPWEGYGRKSIWDFFTVRIENQNKKLLLV